MADLGQRLRTALQEKIAKDGVVAAVGFCADEAPAIALAVSQEHGVKVGRSSVRLRNPANAPNAWQQAALTEFATGAEAGADLSTLIYLRQEGGNVRLAKGLGVEPPCLMCHGPKAAIAPEVRAAIEQKYPEDQAYGFKAGDLRGLIWAEVTPTTAQTDARTVVRMTAAQQEALRGEMRKHLEAVQELIGAIAEKDWERVSTVASSQGPGRGRGAHTGASNFRSVLPSSWFAFARPMHFAMLEIAKEAEGQKRVDIALGHLAQATGQCTACHITFRIDSQAHALASTR